MSTPPTLTELKLSPEMKTAVNTALASGRAIVVGYVDEDGAPQLSYRGSTQVYSDTQLAIWVRNPQGRILSATSKNPAVCLIYGNFDPTARGFMAFRGRARIDEERRSAPPSLRAGARGRAQPRQGAQRHSADHRSRQRRWVLRRRGAQDAARELTALHFDFPCRPDVSRRWPDKPKSRTRPTFRRRRAPGAGS